MHASLAALFDLPKVLRPVTRLASWRTGRLLLIVAVLSTLAISLWLPHDGAHHFRYLANALVHGSFSVPDLPPVHADKIVAGADIYIPLSPLPGILLAPVAGLLGLNWDELFFAYFFTVANLLLAYALLRRLGVPAAHRTGFLSLFFFGTVYLSTLSIGRSWFLAHIIAIMLLLMALLEILRPTPSPLRIGLYLGLAFLTRSPTLFALPVFVWWLKPAGANWTQPRWLISTGLRLGLGLAGPMLFYLYYNYVRFGSPLETGYGLAELWGQTLPAARNAGLFSLAHLPKNLYALLLAMPQAYPSLQAPVLEFPYLYPSPWGMGLFFTTPAFLYVLRASLRERMVRGAWLAVFLVLIPIVTYYGVGWMQFGYRYALDAHPFLFVLMARGLGPRVTRAALALIVLSVLINIWGAWWQMIGFGLLPPELW